MGAGPKQGFVMSKARRSLPFIAALVLTQVCAAQGGSRYERLLARPDLASRLRAVELAESRGSHGLLGLRLTLEHSDPRVRIAALQATTRLRAAGVPTTTLLLDHLGGDRRRPGASLRDALRELRVDLVRDAGDPGLERWRAGDRPEPEPEPLRDPERRVRHAALRALQRHVRSAPEAVWRSILRQDRIAPASVPGYSDVSLAVALALGDIDQRGTVATGALLEKDPWARAFGVVLVTVAGQGEPGAAALLRPLLRDPDAGVRLLVIDALGDLRGPCLDLAPTLLEAMESEDPLTRVHAARALHRSCDDEVRTGAVWLAGLEDPSPAVRATALAGLAMVAPRLAEAVPRLVEMRLDPNPRVRARAIALLARYERAAQEADRDSDSSNEGLPEPVGTGR